MYRFSSRNTLRRVFKWSMPSSFLYLSTCTHMCVHTHTYMYASAGSSRVTRFKNAHMRRRTLHLAAQLLHELDFKLWV